MLGKNKLLKFFSLIFIAISIGATLNSDSANAKNEIAKLADGNYQFCSQPEPRDWRSGAGVCFNFTKIGDRVDGYYAYPHTDDLICLRGKISSSIVSGEALALSWSGSEWIDIPKIEFKWDEEGHLNLNNHKVIRRPAINKKDGSSNLILFRQARLDTGGFYRYLKPLMPSPSQMCQWG
ncbi:MAG: hypothetical protein DCF19_11970 [Pseudanabaena frigida]|uniref:Uncharacterized protein n=1 Tax=Pseudanabaena frigida TaxID=945775 RepID=A0A2W4W823_9CYAN|nr:MAG: hypothetical protein DCF19_11970 [Pseudanabaena frigida]